MIEAARPADSSEAAPRAGAASLSCG